MNREEDEVKMNRDRNKYLFFVCAHACVMSLLNCLWIALYGHIFVELQNCVLIL